MSVLRLDWHHGHSPQILTSCGSLRSRLPGACGTSTPTARLLDLPSADSLTYLQKEPLRMKGSISTPRFQATKDIESQRSGLGGSPHIPPFDNTDGFPFIYPIMSDSAEYKSLP